jgi:hypothetical protein
VASELVKGTVFTSASTRFMSSRPNGICFKPVASRAAVELYVIAMSSMRPEYLRSEMVTPSKLHAAEMPTLRGFDEEFGQADGVTQLDRTRSILLTVALGAVILCGLTLVWVAVDGGVRPKGASAAPISSQNTAPAESRELVDRLLSQVEALKSEVRELTAAQQQPAHTIEAEQESRNRAPSVYWYSDPAALSSGTESGPEPWGVVPLPRRPASPRPTLR